MLKLVAMFWFAFSQQSVMVDLRLSLLNNGEKVSPNWSFLLILLCCEMECFIILVTNIVMSKWSLILNICFIQELFSGQVLRNKQGKWFLETVWLVLTSCQPPSGKILLFSLWSSLTLIGHFGMLFLSIKNNQEGLGLKLILKIQWYYKKTQWFKDAL